MSSDTFAAVIEDLRELFAQFSLPYTITSHNRSCFVSVEFKVLLNKHMYVKSCF